MVTKSMELYPTQWITVRGRVIRELMLVVEVELECGISFQRLLIPKTIIAANSYVIGVVQPLPIQRWFLLRNRIIPLQ